MSNETGWRMTVEKMSDPAGDTHTLLPRPRPATWMVAVAVKPWGSRRSSWVFLRFIRDLLLHFVEYMRLYFSNIVFVLVTTSPYNKLVPNSSFSSSDWDRYWARLAKNA